MGRLGRLILYELVLQVPGNWYDIISINTAIGADTGTVEISCYKASSDASRSAPRLLMSLEIRDYDGITL
eukprot:1203409-Amorphochlora_amoeboformis.AAC.1